ncbi:MAG: Holliday junction branch migration protein RuvA [Proteobacteria bacterium]|nr:Holliday junction branch migration protein RuvA [Pseudomonadota bacterium]
MFGKLQGAIEYIGPYYIILDVAGVGYIVYCSAQNLQSYNICDKISLWIHTQFKENEIVLFGFCNLDEKESFESLISVQGIGGKVALNILGILGVSNLRNAILHADKDAFKRVQGVGPKLASRIINELQSKNNFISSIQINNSHNGDEDIANHAISGLMNFGFSRLNALNAVQAVIQKQNLDNMKLEEVIKHALKEMNK